MMRPNTIGDRRVIDGEVTTALAIVRRRQHGRGGPSLAERLLMHHPTYQWRSNIYYRTSIWRKLHALGLVYGTAAASQITSRGYQVREEILKLRQSGDPL